LICSRTAARWQVRVSKFPASAFSAEVEDSGITYFSSALADDNIFGLSTQRRLPKGPQRRAKSAGFWNGLCWRSEGPVRAHITKYLRRGACRQLERPQIADTVSISF
tara:strand:- start:116 stop:436 length:321 start_codon:yes stop_codon:yes gene_type:complete